nr:hypothetical protein [Tanacetum cinerariifolium]
RMIPEPRDPNREVPVNKTFHVQTDDELTDKELKQIEADDQAIQTFFSIGSMSGNNDDHHFNKNTPNKSSALLIQDWETDSDNDSVSRLEPILAKIDFVKAGESVKHVKLVDSVKHHEDRMAKKSVLPTNVGKGTGQRESRPVWNNVYRINHQNKLAPTAVFTRSGRIPVSAAKPKAAASTSAVKPVNTAGLKQSVNFSKSISAFHKSHSPIRRTPRLDFLRPFGCPDTILNTLDPLGKFKVYARNQTDKNAGPQDTNGNAGTQDNVDAGKEVSDQHYIVLPLWSYISSTFKSSDDKATNDKPTDDTGSKTVKETVNKEDQAYRDELDRLIINAASTSGTFSAAGPLSPYPDAFIPANTLLHVDQDDSQLPDLEDTTELQSTGIFNSTYDDDLDIFDSLVQSVGAEADFSNIESFTIVSPIPTHRVHLDHPKDHILGDPNLAVQTRGMAKKSFEAYGLMEPKKVSQALDDISWVEAMQEELLQFSLQKSNDVTRLQALVDKKKVVVTEAAIRDALHLDDAEGVDCLPNEEIFTELARMEHDKVAQDLEIIKLKTRVKKLEKANKVKALKLRRLRKVGTSQRVDTSDDTIMEDVSNQGRIKDELDKDEGAADIYQIDMDHAAKVINMQEDESEVQEAVKSIQEDESEVHEVVEVVTTSKLITKVVVAVSETVSAAAVVPAAVSEIVSAAAVVPTVTAAPVKVVVLSTRRRRGVIIRDPEEESSSKTPTETKSKDKGKGELNQDIDWEVAIDYVKQKAKEDPFIQRYQVMKKRPQMSYDDIRPIFKSKFNENMEFLLKSKEQIEEEANRAIESINETLAQKAAKRRRMNEEVKDVKEIKQHLEIVPDEDDDVYTEATPLARKVHIVDYQIIHFNNKPHYKIIRADGTHQLYVSFITLLKNFDREDLESLWSLVKERFTASKPNNFSDDYLLTTLRAMFGRPDGQDLIWKSQRSVHGQARVKS